MRVMITGAAGFLGHAVVDCFALAGDKVACLDRVEGDPVPGGAWFLTRDLADPAEARDHVSRAAEWLGGIDALIHLAGAFEWKPVEETTIDDWRRLYAANVETAVTTITAALPYFGAGAAIVTVGAAAAQPAGAGMAPYAAAKAGVARLSEALAQELRPRRIRVNSILPSIIDTPRNRSDMPDADFSAWPKPAAIADAIYFLVAPESRAVNGTSLAVTNGSC